MTDRRGYETSASIRLFIYNSVNIISPGADSSAVDAFSVGSGQLSFSQQYSSKSREADSDWLPPVSLLAIDVTTSVRHHRKLLLAITTISHKKYYNI